MSGSEPLLCSHSPECRRPTLEDNLKRLSLPVIRIWDELGPTLWRTKQCCDLILPTHLGIRRWQSLPSELSRVKRRDLSSAGSYSDSRSNMFSSCSDESVIHLHTTDSLVGGNSDDDRRSPTSSQNGQLRVPATWIISPSNSNSNGSNLYLNRNHNHTCELNDMVEGNLSEPPTSAFTDVLSSLNQRIDVSSNGGKADASLSLNRLCAKCATLDRLCAECANLNCLCAKCANLDRLCAKCANLNCLSAECANLNRSCAKCANLNRLCAECVNPPSCHASTQTESNCRCGEIYQSLLEENMRLQAVVAANSVELARVRKLLETILNRGDIIKGDIS